MGEVTLGMAEEAWEAGFCFYLFCFMWKISGSSWKSSKYLAFGDKESNYTLDFYAGVALKSSKKLLLSIIPC